MSLDFEYGQPLVSDEEEHERTAGDATDRSRHDDTDYELAHKGPFADPVEDDDDDEHHEDDQPGGGGRHNGDAASSSHNNKNNNKNNKKKNKADVKQAWSAGDVNGKHSNGTNGKANGNGQKITHPVVENLLKAREKLNRLVSKNRKLKVKVLTLCDSIDELDGKTTELEMDPSSLAPSVTEEEVEIYRSVYTEYDSDADGLISLADLMAKLGTERYSVVSAAFAFVDSKDAGKIDFDQFIRFVKTLEVYNAFDAQGMDLSDMEEEVQRVAKKLKHQQKQYLSLSGVLEDVAERVIELQTQHNKKRRTKSRRKKRRAKSKRTRSKAHPTRKKSRKRKQKGKLRPSWVSYIHTDEKMLLRKPHFDPSHPELLREASDPYMAQPHIRSLSSHSHLHSSDSDFSRHSLHKQKKHRHKRKSSGRRKHTKGRSSGDMSLYASDEDIRAHLAAREEKLEAERQRLREQQAAAQAELDKALKLQRDQLESQHDREKKKLERQYEEQLKKMARQHEEEKKKKISFFGLGKSKLRKQQEKARQDLQHKIEQEKRKLVRKQRLELAEANAKLEAKRQELIAAHEKEEKELHEDLERQRSEMKKELEEKFKKSMDQMQADRERFQQEQEREAERLRRKEVELERQKANQVHLSQEEKEELLRREAELEAAKQQLEEERSREKAAKEKLQKELQRERRKSVENMARLTKEKEALAKSMEEERLRLKEAQEAAAADYQQLLERERKDKKKLEREASRIKMEAEESLKKEQERLREEHKKRDQDLQSQLEAEATERRAKEAALLKAKQENEEHRQREEELLAQLKAKEEELQRAVRNQLQLRQLGYATKQKVLPSQPVRASSASQGGGDELLEQLLLKQNLSLRPLVGSDYIRVARNGLLKVSPLVSTEDYIAACLKAIPGRAVGACVTFKFKGKFLRYAAGRVKAEKEQASLSFEREVSWRVRPALNGAADLISLESVAKPRFYLRVQNKGVFVHKLAKTDTFKKSASFRLCDPPEDDD